MESNLYSYKKFWTYYPNVSSNYFLLFILKEIKTQNKYFEIEKPSYV